MIKITIGKTSVLFPTSWDDVTLEQYIEIMNSTNRIQIICALLGVKYEDLKNKYVPGFEDLFIAASFVDKVPKFETYYPSVGPYAIPKNKGGQFDIRFESLGQFEDTREVIANVKPDQLVTLVKAYGKVVAIYLQKIRDKEYDHMKVPELEQEVLKFKACEVIGLGQFFFLKLTSLLNGIPTTFPPTHQKSKKSTPALKNSKRHSGSTRR